MLGHGGSGERAMVDFEELAPPPPPQRYYFIMGSVVKPSKKILENFFTR